jgi:hypothetical protein
MVGACAPGPLTGTFPGRFGDATVHVIDEAGGIVLGMYAPVPSFDDPDVQQGRNEQAIVVTWTGSACPARVTVTVRPGSAPDGLVLSVQEGVTCDEQSGHARALGISFSRAVDPTTVDVVIEPSTPAPPPG